MWEGAARYRAGRAHSSRTGAVWMAGCVAMRLPNGNFPANWKLLSGGDAMARKGDQGSTARRNHLVFSLGDSGSVLDTLCKVKNGGFRFIFPQTGMAGPKIWTWQSCEKNDT